MNTCASKVAHRQIGHLQMQLQSIGYIRSTVERLQRSTSEQWAAISSRDENTMHHLEKEKEYFLLRRNGGLRASPGLVDDMKQMSIMRDGEENAAGYSKKKRMQHRQKGNKQQRQRGGKNGFNR